MHNLPRPDRPAERNDHPLVQACVSRRMCQEFARVRGLEGLPTLSRRLEDKLFEEALNCFSIVIRQVERARQSWQALTPPQKVEMKSVEAMWQDAANKGHAVAQFSLASLFWKGQGVQKNEKEAVRLYRLAAE